MLVGRIKKIVAMLFVLLGSLAVMGCISWFQAFVMSFANLQQMVDDYFGPPRDVTLTVTEAAPAQNQAGTGAAQPTSEAAQGDQDHDTEGLAGVYVGTITFQPHCKDCPEATMKVIDNRILVTVEPDGSVHGEIQYSNEETWQSGVCSVDYFSRGISGTLTGSLTDTQGQLQAHIVRNFRQEESGNIICTPEYEWTAESDVRVSISITNGTMRGEEVCVFDCFNFEAVRKP